MSYYDNNNQTDALWVFILGVITIIMLCSKIFGYLECSWWLVFAPLLIPIGLSITIVIILLIFSFITGVINLAMKRKK